MEQFKNILIILYCVFIGFFLNTQWFKLNEKKRMSKREKQLFHASYVGFKLKQINKIVIPIVVSLILINIYF